MQLNSLEVTVPQQPNPNRSKMLTLRRLCWLFCPGNRQLQVGVLINLLGQSHVDGIASLVEGPQQGNQTAGVASQSSLFGVFREESLSSPPPELQDLDVKQQLTQAVRAAVHCPP